MPAALETVETKALAQDLTRIVSEYGTAQGEVQRADSLNCCSSGFALGPDRFRIHHEEPTLKTKPTCRTDQESETES